MPYELWFGKRATAKHFRVFGSKCYIKNTEEGLGKFEDRADEGFFLGYSTHSKSYKCYNKRLRKIVESVDVKFDENMTIPKDDDDENYPIYKDNSGANQNNPTAPMQSNNPSSSSGNGSTITCMTHGNKRTIVSQTHNDGSMRDSEMEELKHTLSYKWKKDHPKEQVIRDTNAGVQTRKKLTLEYSLLSSIEPKCVAKASKDEGWIKAMNEELDQIEKNKTWELVPRPKNKNVIDTKWVFRNKLNEDGKVIRNKLQLVCKGYAHVEGIDFEETFAPIARMEAIRIFLALAVYKNFKVYQMDVKLAFLNGKIEEVVYIEQSNDFQLGDNLDFVCKLHKALYDLK